MRNAPTDAGGYIKKARTIEREVEPLAALQPVTA